MFTGIIEEIGQIKQIKAIAGGLEIQVSAAEILSGLKEGDSLAIDGVCQTVTTLNDHNFTVQAVGETLIKSTFEEYQAGRMVNLESSLTLEKPLGGHMVQGHVQATAQILKWQPRGENYYLELRLPDNLMKYCIPEGSIAVDGISLTIATISEKTVGISIVPYTVQQTTLKKKSARCRTSCGIP